MIKAQCTHCRRAIVALDDTARWRHEGADGGLYVSCRAASFEPGVGFDDSIDHRWHAEPPHD